MVFELFSMFALLKTLVHFAKSTEIISYFDDFCVTIDAKIEDAFSDGEALSIFRKSLNSNNFVYKITTLFVVARSPTEKKMENV